MSTLDDAVEALRAGGVVAIPTDTVYGVAALPAHAARLFEVKRRPASVELPVLVRDVAAAGEIARLDGRALDLARRWWPGPLTLVLPRVEGFEANLGSRPDTVGVRAPAHGVALDLLARTGPLATTSANLHGQAPLVTAAAVRSTFTPSEVGVVVDGGVCDGEPSTVLDCTVDPPVVIRAGALDAADLGL